jgi:MarR family transcriptional regulator, organic hydroperoxide resistance regulator
MSTVALPPSRLVTELMKVLPDLARAMHAQKEAVADPGFCAALPEEVLALLRQGPMLRHGQLITPAQVQLAIELAQEGPATVGELAQRMGVSPSAISLLVDRMVEHGMVERTRGTEDRRVVWLRLTPAAQAIADALLTHWRDQVGDFLALIPEAEREPFVRNVALFARVLGPTHEGTPPLARSAADG